MQKVWEKLKINFLENAIVTEARTDGWIDADGQDLICRSAVSY